MNKKKIFICNTVFQLYTAINMRLNVFSKSDQVDIILTDRTDFSNIYKALKKEKVFDNVFLVEVNHFYNNVIYKNKLLRYLINKSKIDLLFPDFIIKKMTNHNLNYYEELFICNHDTFAELILNKLYKRNPKLELYEFEDGYGTYVRPLRNEKDEKKTVKKKSYELLGVKLLLPNLIKASYIYEPDLYCWQDQIKKVKLTKFNKDDIQTVELLNRVFSYEKSKFFNCKFIILEESFFADGYQNNDFDLFEITINIIGHEKIAVKTHPRNRVNRFINLNIDVFDSPIPWEVIVLNDNFDDKVLITISSNTAFTPKLLYSSDCRIITLYKLMEGYNPNFDSPKTELFFDKAKKIYKEDMYSPDTIEEYKKILLHLMNE